MALLYQPQKKLKNRPHFFETEINDLDYQGLGVAKAAGKTWFVENALPGERVRVRVLEDKRQYGMGIAEQILSASPERQMPPCGVYGQCGGCQAQHIPIARQRQAKEQALLYRLRRLQPELHAEPMISGSPWGYRRRARLSLRVEKDGVQLGFRQKQGRQIVPLAHCEVLAPALNALLPKLTALLANWSQPKHLGHIELVAADNGVAVLLRHVKNFSEIDRTLLRDFAQTEQINVFVQDDEKTVCLHGENPYYQVDGLRLQFDIRDFIQVNAEVNLAMIRQALAWLELHEQDHVLDLFCGMGNFSLPISRIAKQVVGIEGVDAMVDKARANARANGCANAVFFQADLDNAFQGQPWAAQPFNKILLDPPRSGADFVLQHLGQWQAQKILYVSCNPATLVRDAQLLQQSGYRLKKVAMIDMFPQTGHLESMSLFEKA